MKKYSIQKQLYLWLILLLINYPGIAQQKLFTGTINDENDNPVRNARITIKEQPGMIIFTDDNGKFNIPGEKGQILEVMTRDQHYRSLRLEEDQIVLSLNKNDALIPVGNRLELRKEELTSAIGIVRADELVKSSVINPANSLYGKIPGLTVLQNGGTNWNNDPDIFVRGVETFGIGNFINTNILTLVDGFERPLSSLSLAEIESVAVLKDAAALAVFGLRGANGVLLVTTKRGTGNGLSVDVNYEHGITKAFRLPEFLDAHGYASAVNQAHVNDGLDPLYSQVELDRFQSGSSPYLYPDVNWIDESLRDFGSGNKFSISFQEQANTVRYFAVLNYDEEQGLLGPVNENTGYNTQISGNKFNFRANIDMDLTRSTKFTLNLAGNLGNSYRPGTENDETDIFKAIYTIPSAAFPVKTYNDAWGGTSAYDNNPVGLISASGYSEKGRRELMTDFLLERKLDNLIKGLSAGGFVSFDKSFDYQDSYSRLFQYEQITPILDPVTYAITDTAETSLGTTTTLAFNSIPVSQWRRTTFGANLRHSTDWEDNKLSSMLLLQSEELIRTGRNNTFRHRLAAGNIHYSKAGKYFADLAMSINGTNTLPEGSRTGFFPALSLAWKMSDEEWFNANQIFDNLKLRASWGLSGNDQVIQNINLNAFTPGGPYYFGANNNPTGGYSEGRLASNPLTYETSYKSNFGIDASMLGMLDLTLDLFYNKRKGILVETAGSVSRVLGVDPAFSSSGIVNNKGFELGLNIYDNKGDFTYHLDGQLSYARNQIVEMLEEYRPEEYLKRTGQRINQSFGLEATGFFRDATEIADSPKQTFAIIMPGDIKYKDQNNDKTINEYDEIPIGYSTQVPEFYFSGLAGLKYTFVGIEAFFQGTANYTTYLNTIGIFWPLIANSSISNYSDDSWTPATANTATLPRLTMSENANNYRPNSIWFADASFFKLRSLELYFDLPSKIISKLKLDRMKVYARGMNLFSIDKIKIVDPEATGITYPTVSSYNFGIQIGF